MRITHTRRSVALGAALVLAAPAVLAATAAPAQAAKASPGCVTKAEYKKAKNGMSKKKVKSIFGTGGKQGATASAGGFRTEVRDYKTCTPFGVVAISFSNGKLAGKSGVFV